MSLFLLVVENRQFKPPKISGRENFVGAVYEHLPILALPVCYEKGKFIWLRTCHQLNLDI